MARLVHLSDLHFGAHDARLVEAVERADRRAQARPGRRSAATSPSAPGPSSSRKHAEFLERLRDRGHEVLGVPGNHDIPLYDVLRRFLSPLTRYRRYIDESSVPVHRAARRGGARHQHRALADLQGRPHQRGTGRVHPRDLRARRPASGRACWSPIIPCSPSRSARSSSARSAGRSWRSMRSRSRGRSAARRPRPPCVESIDASDLVDARRRGAGHPGRNRDLDPGARAGAELQRDRSRRRRGRCDGRSLGRRATFGAARCRALRQWQDRQAGASLRVAATGALDAVAWRFPQTSISTRSSQRVLAEDLGSGGDVTSNATIAADARFTAEMNCREPIVRRRARDCRRFLPRAGSGGRIEQLAADGDQLEAGPSLMRLRAMPARCSPPSGRRSTRSSICRASRP